jgi:2-methylisocitrate lyase-like PEP mutase family enzyme
MTSSAVATSDVSNLAERAERLRAMHRPGDPLVLVNAWDAASARRVENAGGRAIGTSSAAIAESLGLADDHTTPVPIVFESLSRIVGAVDVPVTADLLDGYGLPEAELVDHLLRAGAVGCNLEDSDHAQPGRLLDPEVVAGRLNAVRSAARRREVDVVINARIDTYLHAGSADPEVTRSDIVRRARRYLEAGADCVYPIRLTDPEVVADLVKELGAPVNANVAPGTTVAELATTGASRISIGPMAHRVALAALDDLATTLLTN